MVERTRCPGCRRQVAKSAKALNCWHCGIWHHITCVGLDDDDFSFMSKKRPGIRWYCGNCDVGTAGVSGETEIVNKVELLLKGAVDSVLGDITSRLKALEDRIKVSEVIPKESTTSFADILKQELRELQKGKDDPVNKQSHQVLVLKPKEGYGTDKTTLSAAAGDVEKALKSVPVNSCRETRSGALVVRLPTESAKADASAAMKSCFGSDAVYHVSEPKKMLPKMTVTGLSLSMDDSDIIPSILNKNSRIKILVESGSTLNLLFTRTKNDAKSAIIKMSPEVRSAIVEQGSYIYVGLTRCRAFDRFWVTQCHHCQGLGHTTEKCTKKSDEPVCVFCAGSHKSKDCGNKDSPKCINCSVGHHEADADLQLVAHFASSRNCPVMISHRNRLIENTNFLHSKN